MLAAYTNKVSLQEDLLQVLSQRDSMQGNAVQRAAGGEDEDIPGRGALDDALDELGQLLQRFHSVDVECMGRGGGGAVVARVTHVLSFPLG